VIAIPGAHAISQLQGETESSEQPLAGSSLTANVDLQLTHELSIESIEKKPLKAQEYQIMCTPAKVQISNHSK
jgi:hypothetical protein